MRILFIDQIKGIAVILMIIYHIFMMTFYMNVYKFDINNEFLSLIGILSHTIFIVTSGINLYLNYQNNDKFYKSQYKRLIKLTLGSIIMTYISYISFGDKLYVKFGILHFILVSTILSYPILKNQNMSILFLAINLIIIVLIDNNKNIFNNFCKSNPFTCFNLGIYNKYNNNYKSLDHFPIFPKYSHFLTGIIIGQLITDNNFNIKPLNIPNIFVNLGQKSFEIYIIHWFILYFTLHKLGGNPIQNL